MRKVLQLSILVAVATLSVAAQAKINYGSEYKCGKERVIVYYCRNDAGQPVPESANYCSVEYPDRPRNNPQFAVAGSVLRSDLLKLFATCSGEPSADAAVAKAQAAKVSTDVFGIQLGDPFAIPECSFFQAGAGSRTCYSSLMDLISVLAQPPGTNGAGEAKTVYLARDKCPSWVSDCMIVVQPFAGKVGYIGVFTKGPGVDVAVKAALEEKYGKWHLSKAGIVTPSAAARREFKITQLYWNLPGLYVHYQPVLITDDGETPNVDQGFIRIETDTARKARSATDAAKPKPKM